MIKSQFVALLLVVLSLSSASASTSIVVERKSDITLATHLVRIPKGKSAKISVNRQEVTVSCRGLAKLYQVTELPSYRFIVEMRRLPTPAIACRPGTSKTVMDGTEFIIENNKGYDVAYEILVNPNFPVKAELE